jgi:hypothetical protein
MHGSAVSDPGTTEDRVAPGGTSPATSGTCAPGELPRPASPGAACQDATASEGEFPELPASWRLIAPRRRVLERHRDRGIGDERGGALGRLAGLHPADWDGCAPGRTLSLLVVAASVPHYPAGSSRRTEIDQIRTWWRAWSFGSFATS